MQDQFSRSYNAAKAGLSVMRENESLWVSLAALRLKVEAAEGSLDRIEDLVLESMNEGTVHSESKEAKKKSTANLALAVASALKTYAEDVGDTSLEGEMRLSKTDLLFVKDVDAVDRWKLIKNRAVSNLAGLVSGGYPVSATDVTALDDAITAFINIRELPKTKRTSKKAANEEIETEFDILASTLKKLQRLLTTLALTEPRFCKEANNAFERVETGQRHYAIRVIVVDDVTSVRLNGVKTTLVEAGISRKSSVVGVVTFKTAEVDNGNYSLLFEMEGYKTLSVKNVKVDAGKLTRVEARMERGAIDN